MGRFLDLAVLLFSLQATSVWAQADTAVNEELENPGKTPVLAVSVSASFPDAEIFGIKVVNGKLTNVKVSFSNEEPDPVTVQFIGGSLWTPDFDPSGSRIVRNLTTRQYAVDIPAGESETIPFSFQTNMHPQELRLNLAAVVMKDTSFYTLQAFNGTVAVVEPDTSILDPQIIFLYFFLLALAIGVGYAFYTIWVVPYFPQKRKGTTKRVATKKPDNVVEAENTDGPAVTTGSKSYNEDWIPAHHIQRPEAKRVKSSGRPKSSKGKE